MIKRRKLADPILFEYNSRVLKKMQRMFYSAEARAKECGRDFSIDLEDIVISYVEICPILEIPILWNNEKITAHGSPSLDRVDNTKGYVKRNIQIISHRANSLKKDYLLCEWEKMTKYMQCCEGKPVEITEQLFVNDLSLSEREKRQIRVGRREGKSIVHVAAEYDLPLERVIRYAQLLV